MAMASVGNLKTNLAGVMDNLIARDEKLDDMMLKTEEMSDLSYSISSKVTLYDFRAEKSIEMPSGAASLPRYCTSS
jgi:hypothetical protein